MPRCRRRAPERSAAAGHSRDEQESWLTAPVSILGVRVELFVDDVERSARFYREVLGFRPARDADQTGYLPISEPTD